MLKNEREREIISILKEKNGLATVKELCETLYASESSIRRDLSSLEKQGLISRHYGGAELVTNFSSVVAFSSRSHHNIEAKKQIARKAKNLIKDGNVVFLDQSSTSFYLASEISENSTLTVITNNIEILSLLSGSGMKVISSGGILSADNRSCLVGSDAESIFRNTYADILFFSTKSLSEDGIISDCVREEVLVRNAMLDNCAKKVFLCDSEKLDSRSPYRQCTLADVDFLVCESDKSKAFSERFKNLVVL